MFGWFKKKQVENRYLLGDLDLLQKKVHYIRIEGREWRMPDLTAREYAEFCALMQMLEEKNSKNDPAGVDEVYERIFKICLPDFPRRKVRKMSLYDSHALFLYVLKRHGIEVEKKKTDMKTTKPKGPKTS
jgi:hypothetical protein